MLPLRTIAGCRHLGRVVLGLGGGGRGATGHRWATFVRNHAQALIGCDFCVAVTATLRVLYVFVMMEVGSRRLVHVNVTALGVRVLRKPVHAPQANAVCEWLLGSLRRECCDYLIPFGEDHLRKVLRAWRFHYNRGHPHSHLGPGLPEPPPGLPAPVLAGHRLPRETRFVVRPILGGLHHEYGLAKLAA